MINEIVAKFYNRAEQTNGNTWSFNFNKLISCTFLEITFNLTCYDS